MKAKQTLCSVSVLLLVLCCHVANAAPTYKIVHAFGSGQDGGGVWASVILDDAGNVYGTTSLGGQYDCGTVFELIKPGAQSQWTEDQLYSFTCGSDGDSPFGGVTFDAAGNLYGTTMYGGTYGFGNVFEVTPGGGHWTETSIYSLGTNPEDAGFPYAGVAIDSSGNLYGTTPRGSTVFELSSVQGGGWTEAVIDDFSRPHDGAEPYAGLIVDSAGNLYGTTEGGGLYTVGTVYQLHPTADGVWQERFYSFCKAGPPCLDGATPGLGALVSDGVSSVYGTTSEGGANRCGEGNCGTVYRLTRTPSGTVKETVLYNFQGNAMGFNPGGGVVRDEAGNLYGATLDGGSPGCQCGVVYELSPGMNDTWTYTVLHAFTGYDGAQPDANLTLDGKGHVFGTAAVGGPYGGGVVFEITP
jgi:uncharacterized repeat protein (TIGR03803 family)